MYVLSISLHCCIACCRFEEALGSCQCCEKVMNWVSPKCSSTLDKVSIKYGGTFESSHNGMQQHYVTSSLFWLNLLKPWQDKFWSGFLVRLQFHRYLFQWSGSLLNSTCWSWIFQMAFGRLGLHLLWVMGHDIMFDPYSRTQNDCRQQRAACNLWLLQERCQGAQGVPPAVPLMRELPSD